MVDRAGAVRTTHHGSFVALQHPASSSSWRMMVMLLWTTTTLLFVVSSSWAFAPNNPPFAVRMPKNEISNHHPRDFAEPSLALFAPRRRDDPGVTILFAKPSGDDDEEETKPLKKKKRTPKVKDIVPKEDDDGDPESDDDEEGIKKQQLMKAVGERMQKGMSSQQTETAAAASSADDSLLDKINPFKAGQKLRQTIDTALTSMNRGEEAGKSSIYYIDDRFSNLAELQTMGGSALDRLQADSDNWIPEILVVGATGEVGRLVVKRLLLDGRFRVRVLVKDLYTKTLNMLGTGVTYCQGDLGNMESLEYAVTDVDKIVFCSNPPRPDEDQFQEKFQEFMKDTLWLQEKNGSGSGKEVSPEKLLAKLQEGGGGSSSNNKNEEWEQLDSVLQLRAQLAEQVDYIGLNNLIQAFQNVRHADYGTSQAAKRSLFKFNSRPEDFNLFSLYDEDDDDDSMGTSAQDDEDNGVAGSAGSGKKKQEYDDYNYEDDYKYDEEDDDEYDDDEYEEYLDESQFNTIETRRDASVKTQTQWIRNKFGHAVLVGRVPRGAGGGEASVMSSRFRSRQDPENGIELGAGFGGLICRLCSDGGNYEAFVRTGAYYEDGIEYVCPFSTATKPMGRNKSKNKFVTVRLPFESFSPVQKSQAGGAGGGNNNKAPPPFRGSDVRHIGFRFRGASNDNKQQQPAEPDDQWISFYLALDYIKLYRSQPEPEFVYISDAQIPRVVRSDMVRHGAKQLVSAGASSSDAGGDASAAVLLDESTLQSAASKSSGRSPEEVYYKYRGEELLKNSGLSYAIARVSGFNEVPGSEASTIDLISTGNGQLAPISRAEIAQVCVSALLDPNALNKSFYVTKTKEEGSGSKQATDETEYIKSKFLSLPADVVA